MDKNMIVCPKCDSALQRDYVCCPYCGTVVSNLSARANEVKLQGRIADHIAAWTVAVVIYAFLTPSLRGTDFAPPTSFSILSILGLVAATFGCVLGVFAISGVLGFTTAFAFHKISAIYENRKHEKLKFVLGYLAAMLIVAIYFSGVI